MRVHVDCVGAPFRSDDTRPRPNPNLKPFYGWNASKALGNIRDLVSMVIGFLVLTLLEQPEKLSKIKKAFLFRTSRDHVYYGSTFRTSV